MNSYDQFLRQLRYALNHIYEPEILRYSPLKSILLKNEEDQISLGQLLINEIEALKPALNTPTDVSARKVYELLYYRYIHCASQSDLAKQLNCSTRQIRREQANALAALAGHLLRKVGLSEKDFRDGGQFSGKVNANENDNLKKEYDRLLEHYRGKNTSLQLELIVLNDIIQPLLKQYDVEFKLSPGNDPALTTIPDVVLRQALLSLIADIAPFASHGKIQIQYEQSANTIAVQIFVLCASSTSALSFSGGGYKEARLLFRMGGGNVILSQTSPCSILITIEMPTVQTIPVLAIDDNKDVLQLLTRYTEGTRYRLISCNTPLSALEIANRECPGIITVDIMMAGVDGWQLIKELRKSPSTQASPIIVCSVISQEGLAKMLGADDFVRKPVSQESFLSALDRQVAKKGKAG